MLQYYTLQARQKHQNPSPKKMSRYYRDPLSEHMVTHNHDLRDGSMGEPSGGETKREYEQSKPKKDAVVDESLRPSHVLGGEKNAPAPIPTETPKPRGVGNGSEMLDVVGEEREQRRQEEEGLRRSGKGSAGVGGLEGKDLKINPGGGSSSS
ncbi:uncharacterized protein B0T15DRAFT_515416 [Chaetomium strumarium]|uniref:Uncharacterized protein n=1 Tax=Chaetomium strumarium TaxID=1170767 RepID=A0AAJ0H075_9PEZI|nr:hypothetical protein B0T15DRAFT_515416 [Chaetomium strumarium]